MLQCAALAPAGLAAAITFRLQLPASVTAVHVCLVHVHIAPVNGVPQSRSSSSLILK